MDKWISISAKRHLELEEIAKSKSTYKLKLDKYLLTIDENKSDKNETNKNLIDEIKSLNDLYKDGVLTK